MLGMQGANPKHDLWEGDLDDLVGEVTWGERWLLVPHRNPVWRVHGPGVSGRRDVKRDQRTWWVCKGVEILKGGSDKGKG